jgi:hypothetical protein
VSAAADTLRLAKAQIAEPDMWCKGRYAIGTRCCAMGALYRAMSRTPPSPMRDDAERALYLAAAEARGLFLVPLGTEHDVTVYNDRPSTTHADVLAMFDRAIVIALTGGAS